MARLIPSLSPRLKQSARRNAGAVCSGAGKLDGRNLRCAPSGLEKRQFVIPANFVLDSRAAVKIEQVRAAAEQHMLAVINSLPGAGMLIGRCAPTEIGSAFKERDAKPSISQGASGGKARESASGDGDGRWLCRISMGRCGHQTRRFRIPFASTVSFSRVVRLTRSVKTSYWFAAIFSSRRR